jgi:hypothetical protein
MMANQALRLILIRACGCIATDKGALVVQYGINCIYQCVSDSDHRSLMFQPRTNLSYRALKLDCFLCELAQAL